jgi:hypothetical protein
MRQATPKLSLVLLQSRVVAHLSKWTLRVVFLLGGMLALASQAAAAPVVFEASGSDTDGRILSGTVTIDTATGIVKSADLTLGVPPNEYGFYEVVTVVGHSTHLTPQGLEISVRGSSEEGVLVTIGLVLPVKTNLVGFTGGTLVPGNIYEDTGSMVAVGLGGLYYGPFLIALRGTLEPI